MNSPEMLTVKMRNKRS